jgi:NADP-dependent 3-hydroxy acid dehydrogenase YdfG
MNDMTGRVCVVTGANTGIGKATALGLARMGATVVMICRNRARGEAAQAEVQRVASAPVDLFRADLSSQAEVRQVADDIRARYAHIHVLIHNAGLQLPQRTLSVDGIEMTLAVNHGAPFLLTHCLLDALKAGAPSRIVVVSSLVQWMAMALMVSTRLWLGGVVSAHRDKGLIRQRADRVRACARPGALLVAVDGLAASVNAFRCAVRSKAPRKGPGRPHLAPWEQVVIGQVVKQYERGRMVGGVRRLVQGAEAALDALLAASGGGQTLHTASIERLNATFRSRLARLVRRTRDGARRQRMVTLGMDLVGTVDNCCTPHDTLTNAQGHRCTPAMAAGLTHHVWTVADLLHVHVPPPRWQPPKKRGRRSKELQKLIEQWAS